MDLALTGRACIVTGATRGIGLATARALCAEGARVLVIASLNYQLNLGYLHTFLLTGCAVVGMHVCHATLRGRMLQQELSVATLQCQTAGGSRAYDEPYRSFLAKYSGELSANFRALQQVARLLREELRRSDLAGRMGGDEFAAMLAESEHDTGETFLDRLNVRIGELVESGELPVPVGMSAGVTRYPDDGDDAQALFALADTRLYEAKRVSSA